MTFVPEVAGDGAAALVADRQVAAREVIATTAEGGDGFTLTRSNLAKTVNNQTPLLAFDPTQVTHPENRSSCNGDSAALAKAARLPHIAFHLTQDPIHSEEATPVLSRTSLGVCVTGEQTHALRSVGADASEDGTGRGTPITVALRGRDGGATAELGGEVANALRAANGGGSAPYALTPSPWRVRRLTPRECERLQGFPDDYTAIPGAADGPRYAALGNSMAVPVMRWIGERIAKVDALLQEAA